MNKGRTNNEIFMKQTWNQTGIKPGIIPETNIQTNRRANRQNRVRIYDDNATEAAFLLGVLAPEYKHGCPR